MHEMGIAMEIIDIVTASIPKELEGAKVERINLEVGRLSAIVSESLTFCFEIATKDTILADAKLNIEQVPVVVKCKDCHTQWTIDEPVFTCRACKGGSLEILSGRELDIKSIEIEDKDS